MRLIAGLGVIVDLGFVAAAEPLRGAWDLGLGVRNANT